MKVGFVSIFGKPNAGKSTLLNALLGEKLAIVSPKVQTTRHRIKGIYTTPDAQIIFSDTPGIIQPQYKLHERMMGAVKAALEDADAALLLLDINEDWMEADELFQTLKLKVPAIVVINKTETVPAKTGAEAVRFFSDKKYTKQVVAISALKVSGIPELLQAITNLLPEGEPFYADDELTDLSERFFVSEIIREKMYQLFEQEIPYQSTVVVNEFKQRTGLVKIGASVIVQRESQKNIIIGSGGKSIKQLGTLARTDIEKFIGQKVFLELFVKVRPKWRDNDLLLREYGYQ